MTQIFIIKNNFPEAKNITEPKNLTSRFILTNSLQQFTASTNQSANNSLLLANSDQPTDILRLLIKYQGVGKAIYI